MKVDFCLRPPEMAAARRGVFWAACALLMALTSACSPRYLIIQRVANELADQQQDQEEDLFLAREASAFYLKFSESVLRQVPDHGRLSEAVSSGFTQYAFAFVSSEAERTEAKDAKAAYRLRERAAGLYQRAHRHAMAALELQSPGFLRRLRSENPADWPRLSAEQMGLAYWGSTAWGGLISLSKDHPDTVADLPLAFRLASIAWATEPGYGAGSLAGLMGSFEAARPGGSSKQARGYFDQAIALSQGKDAGILVAMAESIAVPAGDKAQFESLLRQALDAKLAPSLKNSIMRDRAQWLLDTMDDQF